jgi:hypothetical protein
MSTAPTYMSDIDVGDILNESLASSMALHCDLPLSQETIRILGNLQSFANKSTAVVVMVRRSTCKTTSYSGFKTHYMCLTLMWEPS